MSERAFRLMILAMVAVCSFLSGVSVGNYETHKVLQDQPVYGIQQMADENNAVIVVRPGPEHVLGVQIVERISDCSPTAHYCIVRPEH
jgi:hypothetical protein